MPAILKHAFGGMLQLTGLPMQLPAMQTWPVRQPLWRLQAGVPCLGGFEHWPLAGLQIPTSWHWSEALQTTGFALTQAPFMQAPLGAQRPRPVSHGWPLELGWLQTLAGTSMKV